MIALSMGVDHDHGADAELGLRLVKGIHILEALTLDLLGLKRSRLGGGHLGLFFLDLLHKLGRFRCGDFLTEAEVGPFESEHLLEMPTLPLATGLGLHGLKLGLLLGELGFLPLIPFRLGQTLNWGCEVWRTSESSHAAAAEHGLGLRVMTRDIPLTEEAEHNRFLPFLPVI